MRRTFADPQAQRAEVTQEHRRHSAMKEEICSRAPTTVDVRLSAGSVR